MIHQQRLPRLYLRLGCFVLAILLLWPLPFWLNHSRIFVQASPFVSICVILAVGTFGMGSILGLGFSIMALARKRWFCRNICPVGLLLDGVAGIGLQKKTWWARFPSIGRYIALLTATGAVTGYPLFLWMDPLAFFNSAFSVYTATNLLSGVFSLTGLTILLFIALTSGDLWCARICPLGGTQELLAGIKALFKSTRKSRTVQIKETIKGGNTFSETRRAFLAIVAGAGLGFWAGRNGLSGSENAPLRPPGAIEENEFTGQCVRCGNCMRSCPSKIIHPATGQAGIAGLLAPVVRFETGYCIEECNACMKVCPSGALQDFNLEQKKRYVIGEAILDASLCFLVRGVNDCDICMRSCPFDAVQIYWDEDLYVAYPVVDSLKCNGCGACEVYCPTGNVKAIRVWKSAKT
jgi:MauM/NapG family ferredoxin protein